MEPNQQNLIRFGKTAVFVNMAGIVFSGLVFPALSMLLAPQPAWQGAEVFVNHFHPLQTATFFCVFFLVFGSLFTFIVLYLTSNTERRFWALSAIMVNVMFTAIVFLNYIIQATYIPYLAMNNPPETAYILPAFTMANPGSFAWALEMYGWGGIGISFILMSFIFSGNRPDKMLKVLFLVNGITSFASAIMTSIDMNWLFTMAGLVALVVWNILVFIIDIFLIRYFNHLQLRIKT